MKTLLLLRHGKSSWDDASLDDIERPLSPRGIAAARRMGQELAGRGWLPQRALVSSSLRTRATWELVRAALPSTVETSFNADIYEARHETILREVRRTPDRIETLLVVGHNPGLEELTLNLAADNSDDGALASVTEKFPTGALARLEVDCGWEELSFGGARLSHCLRPRDLS